MSPRCAHFLQGHRWVQRGTPPPPSTHLRTSKGNKLDHDANGNAIAVDASGLAPRLPFIELGEARFIAGFRGSYDGVKTIQDLGFASHHQYAKEFADKLADYVKAGYMINEDATAMRERAALCPPLTFTETYRDHYDAFHGDEGIALAHRPDLRRRYARSPLARCAARGGRRIALAALRDPM